MKYVLIYIVSTIIYSFYDGDGVSSFDWQLFLYGQPVFILLLIPPILLHYFITARILLRENEFSMVLTAIICYLFGVNLFFLLSLTGITSVDGGIRAVLMSPVLIGMVLILCFDLMFRKRKRSDTS